MQPQWLRQQTTSTSGRLAGWLTGWLAGWQSGSRICFCDCLQAIRNEQNEIDKLIVIIRIYFNEIKLPIVRSIPFQQSIRWFQFMTTMSMAMSMLMMPCTVSVYSVSPLYHHIHYKYCIYYKNTPIHTRVFLL